LNLEFTGVNADDLTIQLYDLTGRSILVNTTVDSNKVTADVATLPSGIYLLSVSDKNSGATFTQQVVKE
jgi:hypothetical protein